MPLPGPRLCGVLMAADSNVCANFQEFSRVVKPHKNASIVKKKNPNEINRALRLSGLGSNKYHCQMTNIFKTLIR